jgi:hypothetical protein
MVVNGTFNLISEEGKKLIVDDNEQWFVSCKNLSDSNSPIIIRFKDKIMYLSEGYKLTEERYLWKKKFVCKNTFMLGSDKWRLEKPYSTVESSNFDMMSCTLPPLDGKKNKKDNGLLTKIKGALKNFF